MEEVKMTLKIFKISILICFFLLSFFIANAQDKTDLSPPLPVNDTENCGLTAPKTACFTVSVWSDKKGFLKGLTYKDFEIYDEKEKKEIEIFSKNNVPASITILLDLSGSTRLSESEKYSEIPLLVEGLVSFINKSSPQNEYSIIGFSENVSVLLEYTQNKKEIENTLKDVLTAKPNGNTRIYDALNFGFTKISAGQFSKKVLLVISDGQDTGSENYDFGDIKKLNRKENNLIYLVNFISTAREPGFMETLKAVSHFETLTENSGGRIFYPKNRGEIVSSFEILAEELKNQYLIGFTPTVREKDKWRDIKIKFKTPKEKEKELGKIFVRSANGYYLQ